MSTTRKLSHFRQLSLNCDSPSPSPHHKRKSLKKQFSEDIPDFKDNWLDRGHEIRVSLNAKNKKNAADRPPTIKIAWGDQYGVKGGGNLGNEEGVIVKKCKEVKRTNSGKLTRHGSLENDSILNSRQDLAERFRQKSGHVEKENEKNENKPNLQIFLAHNTQDYEDARPNNILDSQIDFSDPFLEKASAYEKPKYLQPLVTNLGQSNKAFQIRKNPKPRPVECLSSPKFNDNSLKRPNFCRSNTIVVVPIVEKEKGSFSDNSALAGNNFNGKDDKIEEAKAIDVIIRPVTASNRREKFQKRTNSAFHGTLNEPQANFRPPLVRSSSAPSTKPEKSKFLATKRKIKTTKKFQAKSCSSNVDYNYNVDQKEWKNPVTSNGTEVVTMVSLISPSGSDNEECSEDEIKETPKSVLKRESSVVEKNVKEEGKEVTRNMSLRKTVKSVSFQQSSIHAIRSFSASFPARRASMATALSLGTTSGNTASAKGATGMPKTQEKRGTNPNSPDADERVPKRRLVRSNTEETKSASLSLNEVPNETAQTLKNEKLEIRSAFAIEIKEKSVYEEKITENPMKLNLNGLNESPSLEQNEKNKEEVQTEEIKPNNKEPTYETPKEKQCWTMYCKMAEKGINVSYDTILRGMLTPTEYRMRRKTSIAEEMQLLTNPPTIDNLNKENDKIL